jgi:hypothetical protein
MVVGLVGEYLVVDIVIRIELLKGNVSVFYRLGNSPFSISSA